MLTAVRHGRTKLNNTTNEKLRGWSDIPLSDQGMQDADEAAQKLKKLNLPIDSFHTSPLKRSVMTADELKDVINKDPEQTKKLLDWNVGDYTGQPVKSTLDDLHGYIDNHDKEIPGGESFSSFVDRAAPFLKSLIEDNKNHLIVSHNRVMTLIHAIVNEKGQGVNKGIMKKRGPIKPGGIMTVDPDYNMSVLSGPEDGHG